MKRVISALMVISFTFTVSISVIFLYSLFTLPVPSDPAFSVDYSLPSANISLDSSFSVPKDWKIIDESKYRFFLYVPADLKEKGFDMERRNLWIHESDNLRVTVVFGTHPSQKELSLKNNYSQTILSINNLKALVCTYNEDLRSTEKGLNKVASVIFIEDIYAPSFRVEFAKDSDLKTAIQILQTIRFYES